jgi:hypothetical protein
METVYSDGSIKTSFVVCPAILKKKIENVSTAGVLKLMATTN